MSRIDQFDYWHVESGCFRGTSQFEEGRDKKKRVAGALGANRSRTMSLVRTQIRGVLPEHGINPGAGKRFVPSGNEILETFHKH